MTPGASPSRFLESHTNVLSTYAFTDRFVRYLDQVYNPLLTISTFWFYTTLLLSTMAVRVSKTFCLWRYSKTSWYSSLFERWLCVIHMFSSKLLCIPCERNTFLQCCSMCPYKFAFKTSTRRSESWDKLQLLWLKHASLLYNHLVKMFILWKSF